MKLCCSDHYNTAPTLKSEEYLKITRKRKRKSGACEVASRVETEDDYLTLTEAETRNENWENWVFFVEKYRKKINLLNEEVSS